MMTTTAMKAALLASALLIASQASAQQTQKFTATKANEYGLTYTLPVTMLDISIETERIDREPGEFYNYSKKYLGIDPVMTPSTEWKLRSVTVNPRGEAPGDNAERYLIKFKAGSTPFVLLTSDGLPVSINSEIDYQPAPVPNPVPVNVKPEISVLKRPEARQAMTEDMLQAQSTAKRAELAAARIFELRQSRSDIISGQADNMPSDGAAMQLVLDNLARQEAALTAMFTGTEIHSTEVHTVPFRPDGDIDGDSQTATVGRISVVDGLVESDDLSGEPVTITIDIIERGEMPVNDKGETLRFPKNGVAYNIPGRARVTAGYMGRELFSQEMEIAQLGITFGLDPAIFTDKKAPASLQFYPTTGAIKELSTAK